MYESTPKEVSYSSLRGKSRRGTFQTRREGMRRELKEENCGVRVAALVVYHLGPCEEGKAIHVVIKVRETGTFGLQQFEIDQSRGGGPRGG